MLGIFAKGPWYRNFISAKYEHSTQNSFFVKSKLAEKCRQSPRLMLLCALYIYFITILAYLPILY